MAQGNTSVASQGDLLCHSTHNDDKTETIVLLPGLLSSHREYEFVVPYLSEFHIVAVDLNGHSGSSHIQPVTIACCADRVAHLIRAKARHGQAHVVGLSMGGFVGLILARKHPELVKSVFVTGAAPFQGSFKWMAERPSIVWFFMNALVWYTPNWLYWKLTGMQGMKRHERLLEEMRENLKWETVRDAYASILEFGWHDVEAIQVRTLTVAAGGDDVEATRKMGAQLPISGSQAAVVVKAVHAWDLQFPELFARGVVAWIRGGDLPAEFELLVPTEGATGYGVMS